MVLKLSLWNAVEWPERNLLKQKTRRMEQSKLAKQSSLLSYGWNPGDQSFAIEFLGQEWAQKPPRAVILWPNLSSFLRWLGWVFVWTTQANRTHKYSASLKTCFGPLSLGTGNWDHSCTTLREGESVSQRASACKLVALAANGRGFDQVNR